MKLRKLLFVFYLIFSANAFSQTRFPGGVPGAEVWYSVDHDDSNQGVYRNLSKPYIRINACSDHIVTNTLYNFNHSLQASKLCLRYIAPLENTIARNVFFVGEQEIPPVYGHLTSKWRPDHINLVPTNSTARSRFDLANKAAYVYQNAVIFDADLKATINFYNWNLYQTDKRYKSFGIEGETEFFIGKDFVIPEPSTPAASYTGNFPEFISFPFELTANQKNRVESYLALKYGITLASGTPYRNSKNMVFWNTQNYTLFGSRIFGIGRDDISGLNQLQSESVHNKDYLIASVEGLQSTNRQKQQLVSIVNNDFLVFGDNNKPDGLNAPNNHNVKTLKRIWLSQVTGNNISTSKIFFKIKLLTAMSQALVADPDLRLWMLHDKNVTNQSESNFTSPYVEYYEPASMNGVINGFFENVFFDTDSNIYDQFTFGVGPEIIVQVRFNEDCDDKRIKSNVIITGGKAPYDVWINNQNGYSEHFTVSTTSMGFEAIAPDTYTVLVQDSNGNTATTQAEVILPQIAVDLGPDIILNTTQQQVVLDAGTMVSDLTATYQWYYNGLLLEDITQSITVSQQGEYTVSIVSGNRVCRVTDTILIRYSFSGTAYPAVQCEAETGGITFTLTGGVPPFTSVISGNAITISQVHNTTSYQFTDLPFDNYTLTTTDSQGNIFQTDVDVENLLDGIEVDIAGQIAQWCGNADNYIYAATYIEGLPAFLCDDSVTVDASALVTAPDVAYQWIVNGVYLNIYDPEVVFYEDDQFINPASKYNIITVEIYNNATGCILSETIVLEGKFGVGEAAGNIGARSKPTPATEATGVSISAKVYPNPADINTTFYYEIISDSVIEGKVNLYSPTGALLYETTISGESTYTIPLSLITSGTYLITTTTGNKILTNKIIIK